MITTHLLNNTLTKDSDLSKLTESVMTQGVIEWLEVVEQSATEIKITAGMWFIKVTRTTTTPNETFLVLVKLPEDTIVSQDDVTGDFNNIGIQIPANLVNNPLEIVWQEIAEIVNVDTEADNFISLATYDTARNDNRTFSKLTGLRIDLTANSVFYADDNWVEQALSFLWQNNKVIQSLGTQGLEFTDVAISNTKTYTAAESISVNDLCSLDASGQVVWYTSTNDVFIGIAKTSASAGGNVDIQIRGIVDGLTLTYGENYFVDTSGDLTTTDTGKKIWRALSDTELFIETQWL